MFVIVVGCGRVGSELAGRLFQAGHQVAVIDEVGASFENLSPDYRGRTIEGDWAYPSGHTAGATSLALLAAFVLVAVLRPSPPATAALIAWIGALAGTSMTVLLVAAEWHYATDAVGGFLVAVASVLGTALLIDALPGRRREPDTVYTRRG